MEPLHLEVHPVVERAALPCRACHAPIVLAWLTARKGRRMPIDVAPDPEGNVFVAVTGTGQVVARVRTTDRPDPEGTERAHLPHFATCGRLAAPAGTGPAYLDRARVHRAERAAAARNPWNGV